jgi:hypothetical protein
MRARDECFGLPREHFDCISTMSALGQKRRFDPSGAMSLIPSLATVKGDMLIGQKVPIDDMTVECAPGGGQFQAAVLTGCRV